MGFLAQGRLGYCKIGNAKLPVYDWRIEARQGIVTGEPVGNTFSTNFAYGMTVSRFTARIMPRQTGAIDPSDSGGLAEWAHDDVIWGFFRRTAKTDTAHDYGIDDTIPVTIECSDGIEKFTLSNAKPEAITINVAKGANLGMTVTYVSPSMPTHDVLLNTETWVYTSNDDSIPDGNYGTSAASYYNNTIGISPKLLMGTSVKFFRGTVAQLVAQGGTEISGDHAKVYGFELTVANTHVVNAPLDGTRGAESFDAGFIRANCRVTIAAYNKDETDPTSYLGPPWTVGTDSICMRVSSGALGTNDEFNSAAGAKYHNFVIYNPVPDTDKDASANPGPSYRTWNCFCLGGTGVTTYNYMYPVELAYHTAT